MNTTKRRFAAILATGALVAGGLMLGAQAASADQVTGNITLYTSGSAGATNAAKAITSGSSTTNPMYYGISINGACPSGFRDGANIAVFQGGAFKGALATTNVVGNDGVYGTNGLKATDTSIAMDESTTTPAQNPYVDNNKSLEAAAPALVTGAFEVRYYCFADQFSPDFVADKYFTLSLNFDKTAHTWNVPVAATATTLALTATGNADNTVSLAADVKVGGTITAVAGNVTFSQGATALAPVVPTAAGHAALTTAALANPGTYSFTAVFVSTDPLYNGSTSATATVQFGVIGSPKTATITVTIPANTGSLTLSGVPTTIPLGTATLAGGVLQASGNLTGVTVTDTRQLDFPQWSLTGQIGDFSDGSHNLLGKYLGWTPHKTSGASTSAAGPVVAPAPGSVNGLKTSSVLGTGGPTDGQTVTVFDAPLLLQAPTNTPAGNYSATLTITLA